ncbi:uncharacterized protein LAESUDRAFT_808778 [Laetiporus sulphureus 93-53]|uniref:Uncharacterized protein n=1 Tax=Laetiporus sulphureus 93-53 TaxID=1314785 RepID=A0A165HJK5_9APHY|nr:uncharacterized protein LAESUDRAFT_808778 [Laetiporus sulphureus 93-53]KZT11809.1 hypothetical protein LAESUDRAFT_808778 [Laetiporus sulphureus 93-53]
MSTCPSTPSSSAISLAPSEATTASTNSTATLLPHKQSNGASSSIPSKSTSTPKIFEDGLVSLTASYGFGGMAPMQPPKKETKKKADTAPAAGSSSDTRSSSSSYKFKSWFTSK